MKTLLKSQRSNLCIAMLMLVIMNAGCKKKSDAPSSPGTNEVWMQNISFKPSTITVAVNTTIKWTNKDNMDHTATSITAGVFDSGTLGNGGTFSHQFTTTGTFTYLCNFHSGMNGTVIVK